MYCGQITWYLCSFFFVRVCFVALNWVHFCYCSMYACTLGYRILCMSVNSGLFCIAQIFLATWYASCWKVRYNLSLWMLISSILLWYSLILTLSVLRSYYWGREPLSLLYLLVNWTFLSLYNEWCFSSIVVSVCFT